MADKLRWPEEFLSDTRQIQLKKVNNEQQHSADGPAPKNLTDGQVQIKSTQKIENKKIEENIYDNRYKVFGSEERIVNWIMANSKVKDGTNSPSPSGSSTRSFILPTPPEKRTPRSPLIQINQFKRQRTGKLKSRTLFKNNNNNEEEQVNNERKIGKKKDLFTEKENDLSGDLFSNENSDKITSNCANDNENNLSNSSTLKSPDSKLAACRAAFMMQKRNNFIGQKCKNSRKINKFESEKNNNSYRIISETDSPVSSSNQYDKISDSSSPRHVMSGIESVESLPGCQDDKIDTESSDEDENRSAIFIESDSEVSIADDVIEEFSPLKIRKNISLEKNKNISLPIKKNTHKKIGNLKFKKLPKKKLIDNLKKNNFQFIEEPEENIEDDDLNDADKTLCDIENSGDELSQKNINKFDNDVIEDPDENEDLSMNEKTICESIDHSDNSDDDLPSKPCRKISKKRQSYEIIEDFGEEDQQIDKKTIDKIEDNYSQSDSDKTYWSQQEKKQEEISSQKISQLSPSVTSLDLNATVSDDRNVSFNTSSSRPSDFDINPTIIPVLRKKKKPKKGTLGERLYNLINSQVSHLRIWRHQMGQAKQRGPTNQCIMIKIKNITKIYGRQMLYGSVISDTHNLLDKMTRKIDTTSSFSSNDKPRDISKTMITVITVPEVVGTIKIEGKSILRIYPPWEVYDYDDLVINCLYFNIVSDKNQANDQEDDEENDDKDDRVVKSFDCPCIRAKKLVDSCNFKFTNIKPNVIQYLFDH